MKRNAFYLMSIALTVFSFISMKTEAQVTIGEAALPHPASILDLRTKGLLLSKAHLEDVTKFQLSADKIKEAAGMIIYNTNPNIKGGYGAGLYVWSGLHWDLLEENDMPVIDCKGAPANIRIEGFSGTVEFDAVFDVTCKIDNEDKAGKITYEWTAVPADLTVISGKNEKTIRLRATKVGSYSGENLRCTVANACGGGSSIAAGSQLTVNNCTPATPGTISFSPASPVSQGTKVTAKVGAVTGATSYKWWINGSLYSTTTTESIELNSLSQGTYKISVSAVSACGESAKSAEQTLTVNDCSNAPTANMSAISGSSSIFTVTCTITNAAAAGTVEYVWTVPDGLKITDGQNTNKITVQGTKDGNYKGEDIICSVKNKCVSQAVQFRSSGTVTILTPGEGTIDGYERYCYSLNSGTTCWMTENSKLGNPQETFWHSMARITINGVFTGSYSEEHHDNIGYYYSYSAAIDKDGNQQYKVCPNGWTLPTKQDFQELMGYLAGGKASKEDKDHWTRNKDKDGFFYRTSPVASGMGYHKYSGFWGVGSSIWTGESEDPIYTFSVADVTSLDAISAYLSVRCIKRLN